MTPELARAIDRARAAFGDGPYVAVAQVRELDVDGYADSLALIACPRELDGACARVRDEFVRLCARAVDEPSWHDEPTLTLPVELAPVDGVRLVVQHARKRKDASGFNADTRAVQLLEIATPPVIGEPLFRALRHADELWHWLVR